MATALNEINYRQTAQSEPIPGSSQVPNSAGGFSFQVDDWTRLDRFLILGTEGGSYYASQQKLTKDNASAVERCIKLDAKRVVDRIVEISVAGRAPKNDQALFALAMVAGLGNVDERRYALDNLSKVARIGTHIFQFTKFAQQFRGTGRSLRRGLGEWYTKQTPEDLAYQVIKYRQRNGWSHRDLLRIAHPKPVNGVTADVLSYAAHQWSAIGELAPENQAIRTLWAFEKAQRAENVKEVVKLIRDYNLPREAIPTNFLTEASVWEALLQDMPMTAMIRNLATMTRVGLLTSMSLASQKVISELGNKERLTRARIHPIAVLAALRTYASGKGAKGQNTWTPVQSVVDALDGAFYSSFGNVEPANKNTMLAIDVSGSMTWSEIAGIPGLTPRDAAAALALVTAATEPLHLITAFTGGFRSRGSVESITQAPISPRMRLDTVIETIDGMEAGATDCALPMIYAKAKNLKVDTFVVLTDSETWAGTTQPTQALEQYRQATGINAKLVVVAMEGNDFSIADPNDAGMLDVVGFDTSTPQLISDFSRG